MAVGVGAAWFAGFAYLGGFVALAVMPVLAATAGSGRFGPGGWWFIWLFATMVPYLVHRRRRLVVPLVATAPLALLASDETTLMYGGLLAVSCHGLLWLARTVDAEGTNFGSPAAWRARHLDAGRCPACLYDVRNLPTPRCPECGMDLGPRVSTPPAAD